jgi:hypothetical protein
MRTARVGVSEQRAVLCGAASPWGGGPGNSPVTERGTLSIGSGVADLNAVSIPGGVMAGKKQNDATQN